MINAPAEADTTTYQAKAVGRIEIVDADVSTNSNTVHVLQRELDIFGQYWIEDWRGFWYAEAAVRDQVAGPFRARLNHLKCPTHTKILSA
jgi:hypothetical protein